MDELAPGFLFANRYKNITQIGAGGMGQVYKVLDTVSNETLALKIIPPFLRDSQNEHVARSTNTICLSIPTMVCPKSKTTSREKFKFF